MHSTRCTQESVVDTDSHLIEVLVPLPHTQLNRRKEQMKRALEQQQRELAEKRKQFDEDKRLFEEEHQKYMEELEASMRSGTLSHSLPLNTRGRLVHASNPPFLFPSLSLPPFLLPSPPPSSLQSRQGHAQEGQTQEEVNLSHYLARVSLVIAS